MVQYVSRIQEIFQAKRGKKRVKSQTSASKGMVMSLAISYWDDNEIFIAAAHLENLLISICRLLTFSFFVLLYFTFPMFR